VNVLLIGTVWVILSLLAVAIGTAGGGRTSR
jgi:hypothetical protein